MTMDTITKLTTATMTAKIVLPASRAKLVSALILPAKSATVPLSRVAFVLVQTTSSAAQPARSRVATTMVMIHPPQTMTMDTITKLTTATMIAKVVLPASRAKLVSALILPAKSATVPLSRVAFVLVQPTSSAAQPARSRVVTIALMTRTKNTKHTKTTS